MTEQENGIVIEATENKVNIIMDMSTFDLFSLCPQRYDYRHNHLKVTPIHGKSKALDMGGLAHEGLEVYFRLLKEQVHFNDRLHAAVQKIRTVSSDPDVSNSEPEEVNDIIKAVEESCDYWRHEDEQLIIHDVEIPFALIIYEDDFIRIIVTGKIDLLCDIPPLGRNSGYVNIPFDHKTYSRDFPVPRLSNQFMNYCNAVGSSYLIVNRIGLQKTLKPEDKFKRIPLSYDPVILEEWKQNVISTIIDEYLMCLKTGHWRMRFTSCWAWNRRCEYAEICESSGPEAKAFKLESNYVDTTPWDVTKKLNQS